MAAGVGAKKGSCAGATGAIGAAGSESVRKSCVKPPAAAGAGGGAYGAGAAGVPNEADGRAESACLAGSVLSDCISCVNPPDAADDGGAAGRIGSLNAAGCCWKDLNGSSCCPCCAGAAPALENICVNEPGVEGEPGDGAAGGVDGWTAANDPPV